MEGIIILKMKDWNDVYKKKGKVQKRIAKIVQEGARLFKKKGVKTVLDLGCGTGRHTIFLARKGFEVDGTDISQSGLNIVKKEAFKLKLKNVFLKKADMSKIPFRDNSFDAVVSISVINHAKLGKIKKTFKEIERVLRKRGILVLRVVSPNDFTYKTGREIEPKTRIGVADWDSDLSHHYFTKRELRHYLKRFKVISIKETLKMSERLNKIRHHYNVIAVKN